MSARMMRLLSVVACAALLVMPALAGADEEGGPGGNRGNGVCTLEGAWLGHSPLYGLSWLSVYDADSHWTGSFTQRFVGGDPTFMGLFPEAVSWSTAAGTWVRTGRTTFEYTYINYGLDAAGLPVYIFKDTGTVEFSGECDAFEVTNMFIAIYDPAQDPFGDDPPVFCWPDDPGSEHFAQRIPVDPPCEPAPP